MANDASLVQLIADGTIYLGPYGAPAPTGGSFVPGVDYTEIGYYSEDGFELAPSPGDETEFTAHNGDIVDSDQLPGFWTFAFAGLEVKTAVIEAYFDTTVDPEDGSFVVDKASVDTFRSLIGIGISKSGESILYYCPRVKVSDREGVTHNRTTLRTHSMTFRTYRDSVAGYQFKAWDDALVEEV